PSGLACIPVARRLRLPLLHAALNALRFKFHLLKSRAQIGRLALRLAPLLATRLKLRSQLLDRPRERFCRFFRLSELSFELAQLAFGLAQLAFQRKRTLTRRLAAGHRGAVETFALGREEIGVRI